MPQISKLNSSIVYLFSFVINFCFDQISSNQNQLFAPPCSKTETILAAVFVAKIETNSTMLQKEYFLKKFIAFSGKLFVRPNLFEPKKKQ